ncbi:LapA family protein [Pseudomonas sp. SDO528_S397]
MSSLKRLLVLSVFLLLVLVVLVFFLENQTPVSLWFFGWAAPQMPVSVFIVVALLIGTIISPLLCWFVSRMTKA